MSNQIHGDTEHQNNSAEYKRPMSIKTMKEVMAFSSNQQSWLVEDFIPSGQLTALVAPSDVGKSIFCRQLSVSAVLNESIFLGHKMNSEGRQVIYVSTEDMDHDWKEKMLKYPLTPEQRSIVEEKMLLVTNFGGSSGDLYKLVADEVKHNPTALVVVDVLTDIYTSDLNSSVEIRKFLKPFKNLAATYNTAVLFVHHVSKKGESSGQHGKQNVLGSQGIEASMRSVLELRKESIAQDERVLKITKGNYVSEQIKRKTFRLKLTEYLVYEAVTNIDNIATSTTLVERVKYYYQQGKSSRSISKLLEQEKIKAGKSTIAEIIKKFQDESGVRNT